MRGHEPVCGQGWGTTVGQASVMYLPLGGGVEGNQGGKDKCSDWQLPPEAQGWIGEKHFLKGRDNPLLERKSEGQNQHVQNTLN